MHKPPDPTVDQVLLNQRSYDAIASDWLQARQVTSTWEQRYLNALTIDLKAGDIILDLGCGTGQPMTAWFIDQGLHVTGIDQSTEMLALARQTFPQARWLHQSLLELELAENFNAIVLWDALFHLPRSAHRLLLARVFDHLLPGGRLMLTSGGSADASFTDTMFEHRFFYDSLPPDTLQLLLQEIGFHIEVMDMIDLPTTERDKGRIAIVARTTRTDHEEI